MARRTNKAALDAPDPGVQCWDPDDYARNARYVSDLGAPVLDLLRPRPGERILDLGCGDGDLTAKLTAHDIAVVGVDASEAMVAAARARGLDARHADGQALAFADEFDGVFSNAALHWMPDPDAVIAGVAEALKPGGRFVGEFGGAGNVAAVLDAVFGVLESHGRDGRALMPWYFPTAEAYAAKLSGHGFAVMLAELFARPTPIPGNVVEWLDTFGEIFFASFDAAARPAVKAEVADRLRPRLCDADGRWRIDYVRLRFHAALAP